jgi:cation-transporting ATPase E
VTNTVSAVLLAVAIVLTAWRYPFLPRHLTIVSTFTIGIPGFVLSLAPNTRRYIPGFLTRVLRFCIPAGIIAFAASIVTYGLARFEDDLPLREARTTATLVLVAVGLWVLVLLSRPFNWWKALLVGAMAGCVVLILLIEPLRDFYALELPDARAIGQAALIAGGAILALEIVWRTSRVIARRRDVA